MLNLFLVNWLGIYVIMFIAWSIYLWRRNPGIIDLFWSLAILWSGTIFLLYKPQSLPKMICQLLLLIWALRLSIYLLWTRILRGHVDPRYVNLSNSWRVNVVFGFFVNYQLQGIFALIIALPFLFITDLSTHSVFFFPATILIIIGIVGESMADYQLHNFRRANTGQVCDIGFWRYSRHPNYFFELLVWLGFALIALSGTNGWLAFVSPLFLLFIMVKITGPITERQSLTSKGSAYLEYQQRTSMIIPWIRK